MKYTCDICDARHPEVIDAFLCCVKQDLNTDQLMKNAIQHFGVDRQLAQTNEELAELIVAINKYFHRNTISLKDIVAEIADVEIMLSQLKIMLSEETAELNDMIQNQKTMKLWRLHRSIENITKQH